jgi:hypothetical protein
MGDRGQIRVKDERGRLVYLYTHWGGTELKEMLQSALQKKWRWDDAEYLTRIIFETMVGDSHGDETGFGIGLSAHFDIEHPIIEVDVGKQMVVFYDDKGEQKLGTEFTFESFLSVKFEKGVDVE